MSATTEWRSWLAKLKVNRSQGLPSPHKPLLLLVLLDRAERAPFLTDRLNLDPELAVEFINYWSIVAARQTQPPDVRLPFHHLESDKCWEALTADGTHSPHRSLTTSARLSPSFREFLNDPTCRTEARVILIRTYFLPEEQIALFTLLGIPIPGSELVNEPEEVKRNARKKGREVRFRIDVVAAYKHTCALTGLRVTTVDGGSIVDAAHIYGFAHSQNNNPRNGIALCKNAHWLFDSGLWTIDAEYRALVATGEFHESSPLQVPLSELNGRQLILPADSRLWPEPDFCAWHREKVFIRAGKRD